MNIVIFADTFKHQETTRMRQVLVEELRSRPGSPVVTSLYAPSRVADVSTAMDEILGRPLRTTVSPQLNTTTWIEGPEPGARNALITANYGFHTESDIDPVATSWDIGALTRRAIEIEQATHVTLALPRLGPLDVGLGFLFGLAEMSTDLISSVSLAHPQWSIPTDLLSDLLRAAKILLSTVDLSVIYEDELPLTGFNGLAGELFRDDRNRPDFAQDFAAHLSQFVAQVGESPDFSKVDLLSGKPLSSALARDPASGSFGGLVWLLSLFGGQKIRSWQFFNQHTNWPEQVSVADLVLILEEEFSAESLAGGLAAHVAEEALNLGVPTALMCGHAFIGRREAMSYGISSVHSVLEDYSGVTADLSESDYRTKARQVAQTWIRA